MKDKKSGGGELFTATGVGRSITTYIPATILYRGISFVRGFVLMWLLAAHSGQYALLAVAVQIVNIVAPVLSLGLNEAITRYVPKYEQKHQLIAFLKYAVRLLLVITVPATAVLLGFAGPFGKLIFATEQFDVNSAASLAWATIFTMAGIIFYFLVVGILKGLRMFPALALMELSHGVFFLITSLLAVLVIARRAECVVWSYLVALAVPAMFWMAALTRKLSSRAEQYQPLRSRKLAGRLLWFGSWGALAGIIWQVWQIYSLWHLTKFDTAQHSDAFAAARLIGQLILIVGVALSGVVMTAIYRQWEAVSRDRANFMLDLYSKLALGALLVISFLIVSMRDLIAVVLPEQFSSAAAIMPQVVLFFQFSTGLVFLSINFALIEKTSLMSWSWLTGLAANVVLAVVWISGPGALLAAANAAVWACVPALLVTLALIRSEGQPVSRGLLVIMAACPLILLPKLLAASLIALIVLIAWWTDLIFDGQQKELMVTKVRGYLAASRER